MPTHLAHQQLQQHQEQHWWEIGQVISEIPGQGFGHFKFQTPEGRPASPAMIKGIWTPIQPETKAAQTQLMDQWLMQGFSLNISVSLRNVRETNTRECLGAERSQWAVGDEDQQMMQGVSPAKKDEIIYKKVTTMHPAHQQPHQHPRKAILIILTHHCMWNVSFHPTHNMKLCPF